jgi:hypothetical protein
MIVARVGQVKPLKDYPIEESSEALAQEDSFVCRLKFFP